MAAGGARRTDGGARRTEGGAAGAASCAVFRVLWPSAHVAHDSVVGRGQRLHVLAAVTALGTRRTGGGVNASKESRRQLAARRRSTVALHSVHAVHAEFQLANTQSSSQTGSSRAAQLAMNSAHAAFISSKQQRAAHASIENWRSPCGSWRCTRRTLHKHSRRRAAARTSHEHPLPRQRFTNVISRCSCGTAKRPHVYWRICKDNCYGKLI